LLVDFILKVSHPVVLWAQLLGYFGAPQVIILKVSHPVVLWAQLLGYFGAPQVIIPKGFL
jgi:hypothetical protein